MNAIPESEARTARHQAQVDEPSLATGALVDRLAIRWSQIVYCHLIDNRVLHEVFELFKKAEPWMNAGVRGRSPVPGKRRRAACPERVRRADRYQIRQSIMCPAFSPFGDERAIGASSLRRREYHSMAGPSKRSSGAFAR